MSVIVIAPSVRNASGGEERALAYIEWRLACITVWVAYRDGAPGHSRSGEQANRVLREEGDARALSDGGRPSAR
jgi:hypothetical protein